MDILVERQCKICVAGVGNLACNVRTCADEAGGLTNKVVTISTNSGRCHLHLETNLRED